MYMYIYYVKQWGENCRNNVCVYIFPSGFVLFFYYYGVVRGGAGKNTIR